MLIVTSNYRRPFAPLQLAPGAAGRVCSDLLPVAGFVNEAGSDGVSARNTVVGPGLRLTQFTLAWAISRRDILMQNVFLRKKKVWLHMFFAIVCLQLIGNLDDSEKKIPAFYCLLEFCMRWNTIIL